MGRVHWFALFFVAVVAAVLVIVAMSINYWVIVKTSTEVEGITFSVEGDFGLKKETVTVSFSDPSSPFVQFSTTETQSYSCNSTDSQCNDVVKAGNTALSLGVIALVILVATFVMVALVKIWNYSWDGCGGTRGYGRHIVIIGAFSAAMVLFVAVISYSQTFPDLTDGDPNATQNWGASFILYIIAGVLCFFKGLGLTRTY